jgi:hypothetical protein
MGFLPKVFICFSPADEELARQLYGQLAGLERQGKISVWGCDRIAPGEDWRAAHVCAAITSDLVLLLLSANVLSSSFLMDEVVPLLLEQREERGLHIVPVLIKPCDWKGEPSLSDMQIFPKNHAVGSGKPCEIETDFAELTEHIRRNILPSLSKNPGWVRAPHQLMGRPREAVAYLAEMQVYPGERAISLGAASEADLASLAKQVRDFLLASEIRQSRLMRFDAEHTPSKKTSSVWRKGLTSNLATQPSRPATSRRTPGSSYTSDAPSSSPGLVEQRFTSWNTRRA